MNTDADLLRQKILLNEHEQLGSDDLVIVEAEGPAISIDTTLRQATRGRGSVVCVACARDVVCVATSRGYVLLYRWDDYGNEKVHEVEVVKSGSDAQITSMWLDPGACHIMLTVVSHGVHEVHYLHQKWPRARPLAKLRGTHLTALAWPPSAAPPALETEQPVAGPSAKAASNNNNNKASNHATLTESCTGCMLLGTDTGVVHELVIEESQSIRKDPGAPKQLLDLKDARKSICGIQQVLTQGNALLLVIATPLALYLLKGPEGAPFPQDVATAYANVPLQPALQAVLPVAAPVSATAATSAARLAPSQLQFYFPPDGSLSDSIRFGWLIGDVVYHGNILLTPTTTQTPSQQTNTGQTSSSAQQPNSGQQPQQPQPPTPSPDSMLRGVCALPLLEDDVQQGTSMSGYQQVGLLSVNSGTQLTGDETIEAMVMTEWHFIVVVGDHLRAVNRVSGKCAAQRGFRSPLMTKVVSGEPARTIDGLVIDPVARAIYIYSDESLYEVQLRNEVQGLWRVFMELQDWDAALRMCSSPAQRDVVHTTKAEAAFTARDYNTAAVHFAKVVGANPTFEDITLRLIEAEAPQALMLFLTTRLSCLSKSDRAQGTMLASWILELQLDNLNKILLQSGGNPTEEYTAAENELQNYLTTNVEVLDAGTTVGLLAATGRTAELLVYASARSDHAAVLEALLQRPDGAMRALAVLRKPSCPQELLYRFAPGLLVAAPEPFIDLCISARPALEPRRLVPALLRYSEPGSPQAGRAAVLRYIMYAIDILGSTDSAVHDMAAALYSLEDGEAELLAYVNRARSASGSPLFDPRYLLRLAAERNKPRTEVKLLCELGMYEDAVQRALSIDLGLAQQVAGSPPDDDTHLRHRLWLAVAKHVVQPPTVRKRADNMLFLQRPWHANHTGRLSSIRRLVLFGGGVIEAQGSSGGDQSEAIKKAVQLLKEAGGLLKIEDVLPFFPDFVTIDNFKEALCDSLERYNKQIEELKSEMEEATCISEAVRKDLAALTTRTAVVRLSEPCARCGQPLGAQPAPAALAGLPTGGLLPPFFVFPTGLAYHTACCAAEVCTLATDVVQKRVQNLMSRLATSTEPDSDTQALISQLREVVAAEDPRNGAQLVRLVDMPFIGQDDMLESSTWVV